MNHSGDDEAREVMSATVEAICEAVVTTVDRSWRLSPQATLLALSRTLSYLAVEYVRAHREHRGDVLSTLGQVPLFVDTETSGQRPQ